MESGQRSCESPEISSMRTAFEKGSPDFLPAEEDAALEMISSTIVSHAPQEGQRPSGRAVVLPHSWQTNCVRVFAIIYSLILF
jgi:hypothetical protein